MENPSRLATSRPSSLKFPDLAAEVPGYSNLSQMAYLPAFRFGFTGASSTPLFSRSSSILGLRGYPISAAFRS